MFTLILMQLIKMFLILILGFICYKIKLIDQKGNSALSNLLLMIVNPLLIIDCYQMEYDPALVRGLLLSFLAAVIAHLLGIAIARILFSSRKNPLYNLDRFGAVYGNCGFMGIPLIYSILGDVGVFYLTAYLTVFNVLSWTHGLCLMEGKFSWKQLKKGLLSPMVIAVCIGLVLFFANIQFPAVIGDAVEYVTSMNTPLAMLIAGISLAQTDLKETFTDRRIYLVCFSKLILMPLATLAFLALVGLDTTVAYTILIASACPVATTLCMFAIRYDKDYMHASKAFALSSVLSILTIPAIVYVAGFLLG